jgi:hypothetical protein
MWLPLPSYFSWGVGGRGKRTLRSFFIPILFSYLLLHKELTPWGRNLQNMIVVFFWSRHSLRFYDSRRFITVLTTNHR